MIFSVSRGSLAGITLILLALWASAPAHRVRAQEPAMSWTVQASGISADRLGFIYIHTPGQLVKYSPAGDSLYSWSNPLLGNIGRICTLDPMKTLIFIADFNQILFLDKTLSPIADPVNLDDTGFTGVTAASTSKLGGYWIFQGSSRQIIRIGADNRPIARSMPVNVASGNPDRALLIESGDQLLLVIPGVEIHEFDLFGNFIRKTPLPYPGFTLRDQEWISFDHLNLYRKTGILSGWEQFATLPPGKPAEICAANGGWIIRFKESVGWYHL